MLIFFKTVSLRYITNLTHFTHFSWTSQWTLVCLHNSATIINLIFEHSNWPLKDAAYNLLSEDTSPQVWPFTVFPTFLSTETKYLSWTTTVRRSLCGDSVWECSLSLWGGHHGRSIRLLAHISGDQKAAKGDLRQSTFYRPPMVLPTFRTGLLW